MSDVVEPTQANGYYYVCRAGGAGMTEEEVEAFDAMFSLKPPTAAQYRRARKKKTRLERRRALRRLDNRRARRRFFKERTNPYTKWVKRVAARGAIVATQVE